MEDNYQNYVKQNIPSPILNQAKKIKSRINESASRFERRNRVTTITMVLMLSLAGFYDLLQFTWNFVPFIGWIISSYIGICAWLTFYMWTTIKGWGMSDTVKKFIVSKILPAIGCIGILNIGPEITAGVVFTILFIKSEDFVYNKSKGKIDEQTIKEGLKFFNVFRDVYNV